MTLYVYAYLYHLFIFIFLISILFTGVYRLGYNAVTYGKQNCGGMLTTFPNALRASAALCVLCFILLLALGITTSVVLCCTKDMNALLTTSSKPKEDFIPKPQEGENVEVGLVGTMVHNDA
jgi:NADH:ubiquinone oxidoreductase subunit 4 (subunit M)